MSWRRARFKNKQVWVAVDESGSLKSSNGRVAMRYSDSAGAKIYRAGASNIAIEDGAPVQELAPGTSADALSGRDARKGSGFGKAGTRTAQQKAMAAEAARKLVDGMEADVVRCFTDGGCRGNPGPAGSGVCMQLPDGRLGEACESLGIATNNIGELRAIEMALEMLEDIQHGPDKPVAIFTDSSYANGVLCLGWKAKANKELILRIRETLSARPGVQLYWVAGHVGLAGNERADELAGLGIDGENFRRWSESV